MLLKSLKINNIRSYVNETISFPAGSTILSGDIGCGKSSILLAAEFALFGTSRPDLPAELLLRKGTTKASVELTFQLNNQDIIIQRNLKKEKNGIKQLPGHIIINNVKKELTPVELKAEIISLLGYPEEFITKNKNYIFRYTVYTPQEEMKYILQENDETRLDVLRKIFNIDKYKITRENTQNFLRKMRTSIAILKTKTEPLEEEKKQLSLIKEDRKVGELDLKELEPKLKQVQEQLTNNKTQLESLETKQQQFIKLQHQQKSSLALKNDLDLRIKQTKERLKFIEAEISSHLIPENLTKEIVEKEVIDLETQKSEILRKKASLQERISLLQLKINEQQIELQKNTAEISQIDEKEELYQKLDEKIKQKNSLYEKRTQLEQLFEKTSSLVIKNQSMLEQSKNNQKKIQTLSSCPTCLQDVGRGHKNKIISLEDKKIKHAETLLFELNKKKQQIYDQRESTKTEIEEVIKQENLATRTSIELKQLHEKKEQVNKKKDNLQELVKENNLLMQEQNIILNNDNENIFIGKLQEKKNTLHILTKLEFLKQNEIEKRSQLTETQSKFDQLKQELETISIKLSEEKNLTPRISELKEDRSKLLYEEKELSVEQAQLQTKHENYLNQEKQINEKIVKLNEDKSKLVRLKELHHWLESYFLKLTYSIEKQVMINIHQRFNQFFQEWFSMLIEDSETYSRIDDTFTPIIEQNGYEISFNNLSGGERTSAALAYRLALNRVINDVVHNIKTKDLIILDEPTDGFSSEQLDKIRDVLERLNLSQTIIVSHESKIESFVNNIIRVEKESHVSRTFSN